MPGNSADGDDGAGFGSPFDVQTPDPQVTDTILNLLCGFLDFATYMLILIYRIGR